jgi:hypothetical protein
MGEKPLSEILGIEPAAEEALARAGVSSLDDFSAADPDALATNSGIPVDRIRDWQRRARRAGGRARRNPLLTGWLIALIGLAIAVLLGWAMMSIGARRIAVAKEMKAQAQDRLYVAVEFSAEQAVGKLQDARRDLRRQNWGSAQGALSEVEDCVTFMEQVAPEDRVKQVRQVRERIGELQSAVGEQSEDAMDRLDALEAALDELAYPE